MNTDTTVIIRRPAVPPKRLRAIAPGESLSWAFLRARWPRPLPKTMPFHLIEAAARTVEGVDL